jgi:ketosteroid isomerase-like protein
VIGALLMRASVPRSFATQSRMDLEAMSARWSDDVTLEISGPSVLAGRYEGKAEVEEFFRRDWNRLASGHIEAVKIGLARPYAFGLTNTILIQFIADVVSRQGVIGRIEGVSVVDVRRGRTVAIRNHYFDGAVIDRIYRTPSAEAQEPTAV